MPTGKIPELGIVMTGSRWGIVSTIRAGDMEILGFVAHHLDLGADEVHVYLDEDAPDARRALIGHPACRVILCDAAYWARRFSKKGRPEKHQQRQSANATHCYRRRAGVDWLAHIDVDEFLIPGRKIGTELAQLPAQALSARVRPIEALAPDPDNPHSGNTLCFKAVSRYRHKRAAQTRDMFPTYGSHLNGGFLSHVAGKVFVRTGEADVSLRIHNAFRGGVMDDAPEEMPRIELAHLHAPSWDEFLAAYRFRLSHGSYRSELKPNSGDEGLNMHDLFTMLERQGGEGALREFYREVCTATPELCARLDAHGNLRKVLLDPAASITRHFPAFVS